MNPTRAERRTVVVHTKLAGHMSRVAAARGGENGVQIMTMGQLAARLAGGLLRPVDPDWLRKIKVEVCAETTEVSKAGVYSCANPQHEAIEAFRWMRALLASGTPPEEIAITAASPADFDDHVLALSREANIPVHFVHG